MKQTALKLLKQIPFEHTYTVEFSDGSRHVLGSNPDAEPVFGITFKTEDALREVMASPSVGFGEAFMRGDALIEGDMQLAMSLGFVASNVLKPDLKTTLQLLWNYFKTRNTLTGSRRNIAAHYDLGNEFYSLWLDKKHKQYTCAYYSKPGDSLEKAQEAKLDLVCRKLRLEPGMEVVEAGCGWGGFALHAARKYGVKMRSYNISQEQIAYARSRADSLGIGPDQVEYVLDDYRNIGADGRTYDRFVSIGMLEHVGRENYSKLFEIIERVVRPQGLALVHSIGRVAPRKLDPWLNKYIFPGAYIPSLAEIVTPIEKDEGALQVVDVENLRFHYALTCSEWSRRLMSHKAEIIANYNEDFLRMFHFYLEASAASFRYSSMMLFQVLIAHSLDNSAPLTREHIITESGRSKSGSNRTNAKNGKPAKNGRHSNGGNLNGKSGTIKRTGTARSASSNRKKATRKAGRK